MNDVKRYPKGDLIIRTQTMPADTNQNGDIFWWLDHVTNGFSWRHVGY